MCLVYIINAKVNLVSGSTSIRPYSPRLIPHHQKDAQTVSNVMLPLMVAAGTRLIFRIRSKERAWALGIEDMQQIPVPGLSGFMTTMLEDEPIEFTVFSSHEVTGADDETNSLESGRGMHAYRPAYFPSI